MGQKHALVVDDSRSARVALKVLLEKHDMAVHFAESGEEAIEFLKTHLVDVIFMDHTMPGMDGLEAVSVIKADPRTAMIPVMMYTAKEGEVYVGQARALGAVDVLPKQVQPGVLFDMLLKLGLVKDRRRGPRRRAADVAGKGEAPPPRRQEDEAERLLDQQALGMSIQALVKRLLQDQHLELRSDILAGHREFARQVAEDIHAREKAEAELEPPPPPPRAVMSAGLLTLVVLLALLPALSLYFMWSQARESRDALLVESGALSAELARQGAELEALRNEAQAAVRSGAGTERNQDSVVAALEWAVNQGNQFEFAAAPFDDVQLARLTELIGHLEAIGFSGTLLLEAHLGEFCLVEDENGVYRPAEPDRPVTDCSFIGHPQGSAASPSGGQSLAFANFLNRLPQRNGGGIEVQAITHGSRDSVRRYPFSPAIRTAGDWNRVAALNNRVEYTIIPAP
jgi:CheY-like chemotaxis protein